jgi:hypothetical protein
MQLGAFLLLAAAFAVGGCSTSDGQSSDPPPSARTPPAIPVPGVTIPPRPVKLVAVDSGDGSG